MDSSISSPRNVSGFQALFFGTLSAWSASFLSDMTLTSRATNRQDCDAILAGAVIYQEVSMAMCSLSRFYAQMDWNCKPWPSRYQSAVDEFIGDWALADELREIAGRKPVCTGTDRSLLRSVLGPWSPVPKCEARGPPISVEEHTSIVPRPRRQSQNSPLRNSSAIPA